MTAIVQRPLKGSRRSYFYPDKSLPSLSSLDSAFQLQEYISLLIRLDIHDVEAIVSVPDTSSGKEGAEVKENGDEKEGEKESKSDFAVDKACWIYEQLRRLAQDLSYPLITLLQQECTRTTCPEMKAGEWQYLCVAHGTDGAMEQCCAIDYILHTIDSATALLNSPRAFPSRISIPSASHRHFNSLARRLSRIFAHAYFHHREVFEQAEADSSLYARFLALTDKFDLVPREFLVIPTPVLEPEPEHEPPRILAAAAPQHAYAQQEQEEEHRRGDRGRGAEDPFESSTSPTESGLGHGAPLAEASPQRNPSPWKGRSRTDTMVHSEAFILAEELAKNEDAEESRSLVGDSDSGSGSGSGSGSEDEQPQEIVILPPPESSLLAVEEASPVVETQAQEEGEKEPVVEQVHEEEEEEEEEEEKEEEEEETKETDEAEERATEADSPIDEFSSVDPALARESEEVPSDPPSAQPEALEVPNVAEEVDAPTSASEPEPSPPEPLAVPTPSTQPEEDIIPAPEEPVALDEASTETTEEPAPEPVEAVILETAGQSVDAVEEPSAAEEPPTATIEKTSLPLQTGESEDATGDVAKAEAGAEPEPEPESEPETSSEDIKDLEEVDLNDVDTKYDEGQVEAQVVEGPGVTENVDVAEPAHAEHAQETEIKTEEPLEKTEPVALVGETTVELDEGEVSFILKDQDEDEVHAEAENAPS